MAAGNWLVPGTGKHAGQSRTSIKKSAVPLGQHSHHPDQVMPLARVADDAPVALPRPAPRAVRCCRCPERAALVDPANARAYCADHWISHVVLGQVE